MTTPTEGAAPAPQELAPIHGLIRDFSRKPNCDRYGSDGEKIELLNTYFWLRQLTPELSFEKFLELYEKVADYDTDNLKHPHDAVKALCPRSQAAATKVDRRVRFIFISNPFQLQKSAGAAAGPIQTPSTSCSMGCLASSSDAPKRSITWPCSMT